VQHLGAQQGRLVVGDNKDFSTQRSDLLLSFDHLDQVNSAEGSSGVTQKRHKHRPAMQAFERDYLTCFSRQL
jgi:hypothetical protein